jgi:molecular chaperone GrpE
MSEEQNQNNMPFPERVPQEEETERLRREREEYLAGWQRAKADFINYKKDEAQRLQELAKYQLEDVVHDLISVLDNFDLGLAALEKQGPVEKGIYMIRTQLEDLLKKRGLQRIPIRPGDAFDPGIAEAIAEADSDDHPPGSILEVIEAGYKLHGKILRPVRVKVVKSR